MLLIGSRAACVHFPDHRAPNDWDLIVNREEYDELTKWLGPSVGKRKTGTPATSTNLIASIHRYRGQTYELKLEAHLPLWSWVLKDPPRLEEGESVFTDPILGELRRASPSLLLLLKQSGSVHPVRFWRKTLIDYHFLKARVPYVPARMAEAARLACVRMEERFSRHSAVNPWRPATCAPLPNALPAPEHHAEFHKRFARGTQGPLAEVTDAWDGFPSQSPSIRRDLMIELLVEETLVLAAARQATLAQHVPRLSLFNWTLRLLITQELPIRWAYFAVDEYRTLQSRLMATDYPGFTR